MQGAYFPAHKELNNAEPMRPPQDDVRATDGSGHRQSINKEDIISPDALDDKFGKCKSGVGWKPSVGYFVHNEVEEIGKLSESLHDGTHKIKKARFFKVMEPKPRDIMSIHFCDRIYLRSLNDTAIYPQISESLISDNFACQKGKGTDPARKRLREFLYSFYRKHKLNGYRLQVDIRGYYPNMDRNYSYSVMRKRLDSESYQMVLKVLKNHPGDIGYHPGDQTIQNVGIAALDDLDHFIKEQLRIKYYIRYMDDFILLHEDRQYLEECREKIREILTRQKMVLNMEKTEIKPIKDTFIFLGFSYRLTESGKVVILVDPKKIKHEKLKLRRMASHVINETPIPKKKVTVRLTKKDVDRHFRDFKSCIRFGDSVRTIEKLNRYYKNLWKGTKYERNQDQKTEDGNRRPEGH